MPVHRPITLPVVGTARGLLAHPDIPAFPLEAFRAAHPSGQLRCGSCGELVRHDPSSVVKSLLEHMPAAAKRLWGPETPISVSVAHDFYPYQPHAATPDCGGEPPATLHVLVYEDGAREKWLSNDDGQRERYYGIVYRNAASLSMPHGPVPAPVFREVWYPTGEFREL